MHILCINALKLLSAFYGQGLAFFGEDRLVTMLQFFKEHILDPTTTTRYFRFNEVIIWEILWLFFVT